VNGIVAIAGGLLLALAALLPWRAAAGMERRRRSYFRIGSVLLVLVGLGIAIEAWSPVAGAVLIFAAVVALLIRSSVRRRITR
jgi:hypothetical protein